MDIFESASKEDLKKSAPLADRMRPRNLDEYIGQIDIVGKGRLLRRAIEADRLSSIIFYGPPGTGKTTLARVIANSTKSKFITINAVLSGIKDIREAVAKAKDYFNYYSKRTILFIDEVHRFNKSQQDALLPHIENGVIILIGATTENPYFEVNKALISRSRIFQLTSHTDNELLEVMNQAIRDKTRGYGNEIISMDEDAITHLVKSANGDARSLLNALELSIETTEKNSDNIKLITEDIISDSMQKKAVLYDKDGDAHYDIISAFIKSIRGSDPDGALYWLAKMIYAGEDPKFIFRRMIISATEDVGMADPNAIQVVMAASQAYDYIGMPEGRFPLSQACLYLATAPKSNTTLALFDALKVIEKESDGEVPNHLKDSSRDGDDFGHGDGYLYPHAYRGHWVAQQYLPKIMQGRVFYEPSEVGYEKGIQISVARKREVKIAEVEDRDKSSLFIWSGGEIGEWEERVTNEGESVLENLRDDFFNYAGINIGDVVLDLNCGIGLFTFEAVRAAKNGLVISYTNCLSHYRTIKEYSLKIDELERPISYKGNYNKIVEVVNDKDLDSVTKIIGRDFIFTLNGDFEVINILLEKCSEIILSESISSMGSRISDFIEDDNISKIVKAAEDNIFEDRDNKVAFFTLDNFKDWLQNNGKKIRLKKYCYSYNKTISKRDIDWWLRTKSSTTKSLGEFIIADSGITKFKQIESYFKQVMVGSTVNWKYSGEYIKIRNSVS